MYDLSDWPRAQCHFNRPSNVFLKSHLGRSQTFTWVGSLDKKVDLLCGLHHGVLKKYLRSWEIFWKYKKAKFGDISDFQSLKNDKILDFYTKIMDLLLKMWAFLLKRGFFRTPLPYGPAYLHSSSDWFSESSSISYYSCHPSCLQP